MALSELAGVETNLEKSGVKQDWGTPYPGISWHPDFGHLNFTRVQEFLSFHSSPF